MSLQNIVANFVVDINALFTGKAYNKTMLSFAYLPQIYPEFTQIANDISNRIKI